MSLAITPLKAYKTFTDHLAFYNIVANGNYVAGGDTLNLATIPQGTSVNDTPIEQPTVAFILDGSNIGGYKPELIPGATLQTWKLQFWNGTTQLAAGAYPASILAGIVKMALSRRSL